ncbi:hypothetical protein Tco_1299034 [Tanacetum coccineum]
MEKIVLIKQRMQVAQDQQKSYTDWKRKPIEFKVGDRVMLKVLAKVGKIAYRLELPQELSIVHHTFHVSNLKKCYAGEPLVMPLEGIHVDNKLYYEQTSSRDDITFAKTGIVEGRAGSGPSIEHTSMKVVVSTCVGLSSGLDGIACYKDGGNFEF